ncbi:MAG: hypothetical protein ACLP2Q_04765 [Steroidobacteraceae bacterium]|jgi:hypothetical protein
MRNLPQNLKDGAIQYRNREMRYFRMLDRTEQAQAIHRLAKSGYSPPTIAAATALSVEMVRKILGEQRAIEKSA